MIETTRASSRTSDREKERLIAEIRFDSDQRALGAATQSGRLEAVVANIVRIEKEWNDGRADQSVKILSLGAAHLLSFRQQTPEIDIQIVRIATRALERMAEASISAADEAAAILALQRPVAGGVSKPVNTFLDREKVLDKYLHVQQRADEYLKTPFEEHVAPFTDRSDSNSSFTLFGSPPEEVERLKVRTENYAHFRAHESQWMALTDTNRGPSGVEMMQRRTTLLVQQRFSLQPDDLRIVQASLDRHITNRALKEKLILAIYKGQNPFASLPATVNPVSPGPRKPGIPHQIGKSVAAGKMQSMPGGAPQPVLAISESGGATAGTGTVKIFLVLTAVCLALLGWILLRARRAPHPPR